jgi:hypothetical protein
MAEQSNSPQLPYPEAEYRKPATTAPDILEEELGFYADGPSFRAGIVAISRIYEDTDLMRSFTSCSRLAVIGALAQGKQEPSPNGLALHFLAGETLAMHASLRPATSFVRQRILGYDLLGAMQDQQDKTLIHQAMADIAIHRAGTWQELLDAQTPEHQELLVEATARMYEDIPNVGSTENDFMAGYLYADDVITSLKVFIQQA